MMLLLLLLLSGRNYTRNWGGVAPELGVGAASPNYLLRFCCIFTIVCLESLLVFIDLDFL